MPLQYLTNYLNLDSNKEYAEFKYYFVFDDDEIIYEYNKKDPFYLIDEKVIINNKEVLYFNYFDKSNNHINEDLIGNLKIELIDNKLSIIKYIYRNTPTNQESPFYKMMNLECILYGCKGLFFGLIASVGVTYLIYFSLRNQMILDFYIPWYSVVIAVFSVFFVVFFTMLYAMRKIQKDNVAETLKSDVF